MTKTNKELKTQADELFQGVRKIERYTAIIRSIDTNIYDISCYGDAINSDHPHAETVRQALEDLSNLSEILLEGFGKHADALGEMADQLSRDLLY